MSMTPLGELLSMGWQNQPSESFLNFTDLYRDQSSAEHGSFQVSSCHPNNGNSVSFIGSLLRPDLGYFQVIFLWKLSLIQIKSSSCDVDQIMSMLLSTSTQQHNPLVQNVMVISH